MPMLFLADMTAVIAAGAGIGGLLLGLLIGFLARGYLIGQTVSKARAQADEIVRLAEAKGRTLAEQARLEGQQQLMAERQRFEAESAGKREELRELERRLAKREDQHERQVEELARKEEQAARTLESLRAKEQKAAQREDELERLIDQQKHELLRIGDLTVEQARERVLAMVERDVRDDAAHLIRKVTEDAQAEAKSKAREITLMAVQRYAGEHATEGTVRSIPIPSDDIKGRIIGREGRNIRAIEKATGVDLIVDDTPGVIVVSCFDKVRQAVAAEALQKLIEDGRIHPSRIEEVVSQVQQDMEQRITKHGKDAVAELRLRGLHPKVIDAMGRLQFRTSYGQNILRHSMEVAYIAQIIADQLGLDGEMARRCGFLHDIGKAMDQEMEGSHPKIGMDFARSHGEKDPVLNVIGGHHGDIPATTFYTPIVMAADAISGARPGARRESLERYIQRLEQLQDIAKAQEGVTEAFAIQAGREVRVMVDAKRVSDDTAYMIAKRIADKVSAEMTFPGEIKVTVLRETRAVEVAR
ncbi:MAG: ribonuclease Y [Phycisphaerales bacterium]|nr:ribonuclease Y [Phycisphaerales bacterium]